VLKKRQVFSLWQILVVLAPLAIAPLAAKSREPSSSSHRNLIEKSSLSTMEKLLSFIPLENNLFMAYI
jgi:hypothetical protein